MKMLQKEQKNINIPNSMQLTAQHKNKELETIIKHKQNSLSSNFNSSKKINFYDIEKSKGTELVMMWSWKDIEMKSNERIATFWLCGCTAVWIILEKNGIYTWYIQHYPPLQKNESIRKLISYSRKLENLWRKIKKSVIMSPWEREQNSEWKREMVFKDNSLVQNLTWSLQVSKEEIINAPYSEVQQLRNYWQWTMAIWVKDWEPYIEVESIKKWSENSINKNK